MGKVAKVSPLAPKSYPQMPALAGVRLGAVEAGIKYSNRLDLGATKGRYVGDSEEALGQALDLGMA